MALNPVILENGVPEVTVGETFLLSRGGIMFSVKAKEAGKFTGKGVMYLTSHSLFFVCEKPVLTRGISFSSFRIPITSLSDEKFNQPIFGANNLSGRVTPVVGAEQGLSDWTFAFYFKNGGCGTFLPLPVTNQSRRESGQQVCSVTILYRLDHELTTGLPDNSPDCRTLITVCSPI